MSQVAGRLESANQSQHGIERAKNACEVTEGEC